MDRQTITTEEVERALKAYRCQHSRDAEDEALALADLLTPPGQDSIALGLEEIELLADFLADVIATGEFAAPSQPA